MPPHKNPATILLVSSDAARLEQVEQTLAAQGWQGELRLASTLAQGRQSLAQAGVDAVLCDWELSDGCAVDWPVEAAGEIALVLLLRPDQIFHGVRALREGWGDFVVLNPNTQGSAGLLHIVQGRISELARQTLVKDNQRRVELSIEGAGLVAWEINLAEQTIDDRNSRTRLLGYPHSDAPWTVAEWVKLIHPDDRAKVGLARFAYEAGHAPVYECEYRVRHQDGHWVWVFSRGQVADHVPGGKPTRMLGAFIDITASRKAQEDAARQTQLLKAIGRSQAAFIDGWHAQSVLKSVLADYCSLTESPHGFVGEVDGWPADIAQAQPPGAVWVQTSTAMRWPQHEEPQIPLMGDATPAPFGVTAQDPLLGESLKTGEAHFRNGLDRAGVQSLLSIPIYFGTDVLALLVLVNRPGGYSRADIDFLAPLSSALGQLVHARRIEHERLSAVDALRRASDTLNSQIRFIERITSQAPGVIFQMRVTPGGRFSFPYASGAFFEFFGLTIESVAMDASNILGNHYPPDLPALNEAMSLSAKNLAPWQHEYRVKHPDGGLRWIYTNALPEREPDGSVLWCGFITDITQRKEFDQTIQKLAFFDELTGLPNRRMVLDRLNTLLKASARTQHCGALMFIDLDNFKDLNDTQGHDAGDLLLKQAAQRLSQCVRSVDTVARLGGDEFVVLLTELNVDAHEAASEAERVGRKVITALNQPYLLGTHTHHSTPSIGVAVFNNSTVGVEDILKRADLAMYQAKAAGKNGLCFFDPAMQLAVTQRADLEVAFRKSLCGDDLRIFFQPVVDRAGVPTGLEALVRWQHPMRGMVSPADFIPMAERTGLIVPMGLWVIEQVCAQLELWNHEPLRQHLSISVNVSARQFRHKDFVRQVRELVRAFDVKPDLLKLELTESMLHIDVQDVIEKMTELRALGVAFSLDDFGTGYSSLSYLKRLPLDQLKIDQSFVRDILTDPNDAAIARTILSMAASLDLGVVAEGVETEAQYQLLLSFGCKAFQGYFFGRPAPIEAFKPVPSDQVIRSGFSPLN